MGLCAAAVEPAWAWLVRPEKPAAGWAGELCSTTLGSPGGPTCTGQTGCLENLTCFDSLVFLQQAWWVYCQISPKRLNKRQGVHHLYSFFQAIQEYAVFHVLLSYFFALFPDPLCSILPVSSSLYSRRHPSPLQTVSAEMQHWPGNLCCFTTTT